MTRVLLLGGTSQASQMARRLAESDVDALFSYAGRTKSPVSQPLPTRVGGFGGAAGLIDTLAFEKITHVIDATHPFAAGMSRNAFAACQSAQVPLIRLERPPWKATAHDSWQFFDKVEDIPAALPKNPARVFLAIGKQQIGLFAARPEHHYLLRLVDAPEAPLPLPNADVIIARGPFREGDDRALMTAHGITHVVAKNSGGHGASAKLDAARALRVPVLMAQRPPVPGNTVAQDVGAVMDWLAHNADRGV